MSLNSLIDPLLWQHEAIMTRFSRLLAPLWPLTAALLVASALGCGGNPPPPAGPGALKDKPEPRQNAADPTQGPKPRTGTPAEMLLGKWENAEQDRGFEFCGDGIVKLSLYRQLPISGTYKLLDADAVEWKFPQDEKAHRYQFAVTPTTVMFTPPDKEAEKVVFKAVDVYAKELNHPNRQPNEQQRKWIVGSWRGVEKEFDHENVYLYAFYADGTFSVLKNDGFPFQTSLEMGAYRVHPDADNFLELTYPDTGETDTVYAEIGEKELALTGSGEELCKHQRMEDKEERTRPVRADVLTAFALFRECAASPDKSREKYAGKPIEVTGSVGEYLSVEGKSEIYLLTGKSARVKCVLDTTDKATADALRQMEIALFGGGKVQIVTVRGSLESIVKEEDKAGQVVARVVGGEPVEKGPQLFVRLSECKVTAHSDLTVK